MAAPLPTESSSAPALARRLGPLDVTLIVMGGIIGSGIFMNPAVVARHVHTPALILAAWGFGGVVALAGAFVYAELAARRPHVGGQYAYLRDAFHPALAFAYGWGLLLVVQSGGMAAVAITFARYFRELTGLPLLDGVTAALALGALTAINLLGVRAGGAAQNGLMVLKIGAVLALVVAGAWIAPAAATAGPPAAADSLAGFGAALAPVMFAYGGWQTASFLAGEVKAPRRDLPRGLVLGVLGVIALYVAVSAVCLRVLGAGGLAATTAPATAVMRAALGESGARLIAAGIAISTLGFLSQSMLTAPRVYYAMAADGVFPAALARLHPVTRVPALAIVLQGTAATLIAWSGSYERILGYVVAVDWIFFALTACALFVFRRREGGDAPARVPLHPWTTAAFVLASAAIVAGAVMAAPGQSAIGIGLLAASLPAYAWWRRRAR